MNRRSTALTFAVVCLVALFAIAFLAPMPYVVMSPGVTENTLGAYHGRDVVTITGHRTYRATGHLNLTTVSVTSADYSVRLPQVLDAWWSSNQIVLPRDVIYPPDQTVQQVEKVNTTEMVDSQSAAVIAGLQEAGIHRFSVDVAAVLPHTPAAAVLKAGDQITSVNGTAVGTIEQTSMAISGLAPGSSVTLGLVRAGHPTTVRLTTAASPTDASKSRIGVELTENPPAPLKVDIKLGQDIGGPSAGLMFSLAIYDKLTPGSLTGGRFVAGTGTISMTGQVGEIGGIQQKIAGAYAAGARYFLVPAANCGEATSSSVASKISLIKVSTLDQAVKALTALDSGDVAAIPRCGS